MIQLPPETRRVGRPYLPVAVAALAFLLMATVVSPVPREQETIAGPVDTPFGTPVDEGVPTEGTAGPDGSPAGGSSPQSEAGGPEGASPETTQPVAGGGVQRCTDRELQVPGDPYSPPCLTFSGSNGGATHVGVTEDEIVVTIRELEGPSAAEIFSDISGENVSSSDEAVKNTLFALGEYFQTRYQFYGRTLRFEFFKGEGNGASELLGGGKEKALADSQRAVEKGAFADLTGITLPYLSLIHISEPTRPY